MPCWLGGVGSRCCFKSAPSPFAGYGLADRAERGVAWIISFLALAAIRSFRGDGGGGHEKGRSRGLRGGSGRRGRGWSGLTVVEQLFDGGSCLLEQPLDGGRGVGCAVARHVACSGKFRGDLPQ